MEGGLRQFSLHYTNSFVFFGISFFEKGASGHLENFINSMWLLQHTGRFSLPLIFEVLGLNPLVFE